MQWMHRQCECDGDCEQRGAHDYLAARQQHGVRRFDRDILRDRVRLEPGLLLGEAQQRRLGHRQRLGYERQWQHLGGLFHLRTTTRAGLHQL